MSEVIGPGGYALQAREIGRYGTGLKDFNRDECYRVQEAARDALERNRRLMPEPSEHETLRQYRERICDALKGNTSLARLDLSREPPEIFADSEARIIRESAENYLKPRNVEAGKLVEVKRIDRAGREIIEFATGQKGNPNPETRPVSSFKETYRKFRDVGFSGDFVVDGVVHKPGFSAPVLKE
jgi:hypothetical protein